MDKFSLVTTYLYIGPQWPMVTESGFCLRQNLLDVAGIWTGNPVYQALYHCATQLSILHMSQLVATQSEVHIAVDLLFASQLGETILALPIHLRNTYKGVFW